MLSHCVGVFRYVIIGSGRSPGEGLGYPLQYSWAALVAQTKEFACNAGYSGEKKAVYLAFTEFTDECDQTYRLSVEHTWISKHIRPVFKTLLLLLLLLSRFSCARLCVTP